MDAYEFMDLYSDDTELYHHGIKGQKWGVRNGPPYPLGSGKDPKIFLDKYKNRRAGDLARDWNDLTLESKINVIGVGTGAVIAVMTAIGAIGKYHIQRQNLKLEKEKEKRLREKEKRLQEQRLEKKTKDELAGAVKKKMEDMTNAELQKEIERMRLESEYKRLDKSTESEASKFFKETGKKVAQQAISSSVSLLISRYGPNALNAVEQTAINISNKKRSRLANDNEYDLKPSRSDLKKTADSIRFHNNDTYTKSKKERSDLEFDLGSKKGALRVTESRYSSLLNHANNLKKNNPNPDAEVADIIRKAEQNARKEHDKMLNINAEINEIEKKLANTPIVY